MKTKILFLLIFSFGIFHYSYSDSSFNDDFSIKEGKLIEHVEELVKDYSGKESPLHVIKELESLYYSNANSFMEIVILTELVRIKKVDTIKGLSNNWAFDFALKLQNEPEKIASYIGGNKNPGQNIFLETWTLLYNGNQSLEGKFPYKSRLAHLLKSKQTLDDTNRNLPKEKSIELYFNKLINGETPFESEAALLSLVRLSQSNSKEISLILIEELKRHEPTTPAPPYEKDHTIFTLLCELGKSLAEPKLISILELLSTSENIFVREQATDALNWIRSGVHYPIHYKELRRAYYSRS